MASNNFKSRLVQALRVAVVGRHPKRTAIRVIILIAVSAVVFKFILLPIRVRGISMEPTYHDGSVNFVNRLAFLRSEPRRGDIVAVRLAGDSIMYLKRIIGMPGETVAFHEGHAVIDGKILDELYLKNRCDWDIPPRTIEPGHYYVVGDNRSQLEQDHVKGLAARNRIIGKPLL